MRPSLSARTAQGGRVLPGHQARIQPKLDELKKVHDALKADLAKRRHPVGGRDEDLPPGSARTAPWRSQRTRMPLRPETSGTRSSGRGERADSRAPSPRRCRTSAPVENAAAPARPMTWRGVRLRAGCGSAYLLPCPQASPFELRGVARER